MLHLCDFALYRQYIVSRYDPVPPNPNVRDMVQVIKDKLLQINFEIGNRVTSVGDAKTEKLHEQQQKETGQQEEVQQREESKVYRLEKDDLNNLEV